MAEICMQFHRGTGCERLKSHIHAPSHVRRALFFLLKMKWFWCVCVYFYIYLCYGVHANDGNGGAKNVRQAYRSCHMQGIKSKRNNNTKTIKIQSQPLRKHLMSLIPFKASNAVSIQWRRIQIVRAKYQAHTNCMIIWLEMQRNDFHWIY